LNTVEISEASEECEGQRYSIEKIVNATDLRVYTSDVWTIKGRFKMVSRAWGGGLVVAWSAQKREDKGGMALRCYESGRLRNGNGVGEGAKVSYR